MRGSGAAQSIEILGLTRKFGSLLALRRVELAVGQGESLALFGPNGAGKTTLIRILTLGLRPTGGEFRIAGYDPGKEDTEIRQRIGVISHQAFLYADLSARQNLEFFARLYGVPDPGRRAMELLETVALSHRAEDPLRTFSRGMQQRVSFARSLVHDPGIIFLDEPFTGLDPHAAQMLRATLARLREDGRTIFLVTHNLAEGLELSDRWAILARGRVVDQGTSDPSSRVEFEKTYFERVARSTKPS